METSIGDCRDYYRDPFPHSLLSTRQSGRGGMMDLECPCSSRVGSESS